MREKEGEKKKEREKNRLNAIPHFIEHGLCGTRFFAGI